MDITEPSLEVPGEPGAYWCARHKKEKTWLRCGRCEKPICVRCVVHGPAGARCRDCASNRNLHVYRVSPIHYLAAFGAAFILSAIGAAVFQSIGFIILFYAVFAGSALGKITALITRGKRGVPLAAVTAAGAVAGALAAGLAPAGFMMLALHRMPHATITGSMLAAALLANPWLWLYILLVVPVLWYWIR